MTRFKRLLATTDFSKGANCALDRAALLASQHGADLEFLHVVDRRPIEALARHMPVPAPMSEAQMMAAADRKLEELAARAAKRHGIRVTLHTAQGVPYREIIARAAGISADLTVIGAHGKHFIKRLFVGATMQKVARASPGAVLIVRNEAPQPYERVLLPVDLASDSRAAFDMAGGAAPGASVYVLHAYEPLFEDKATYAGASEEALAHYRKTVESDIRTEMDALIKRAVPNDTPVTRLIRRGYAPAAIEQAAQELNIDLIVIGAGGQTELTRFFLGSVSLHVMLEANTDLLLVRGAATQASS